MNEHDFKENLLINGADLRRWPEEIRQAGLDALLRSPSLGDLVAEQAEYDRVLESRGYDEPSGDLADRIIRASLRREQRASFSLSDLLSELLGVFVVPERAIVSVSTVMIILLLIGFAIGFSDPFGSSSTEQASNGLQDILYSEGALL